MSGKTETTPDIWINVLPDAESQADEPTGPYVSEIESLIAQLNTIKSQMQSATTSETTAAGRANDAAADAAEAAEEARAAAGMVSQDKTIFLEYEQVGDVKYLTLTDKSED